MRLDCAANEMNIFETCSSFCSRVYYWNIILDGSSSRFPTAMVAFPIITYRKWQWDNRAIASSSDSDRTSRSYGNHRQSISRAEFTCRHLDTRKLRIPLSQSIGDPLGLNSAINHPRFLCTFNAAFLARLRAVHMKSRQVTRSKNYPAKRRPCRISFL